MFLLNSRLGLFSAAHLREHPFSLSYGVNLPSSLTTLLPLVLGFSPHLPVSVCGTGIFSLVSSFSRQREIISFVTILHSPSQPSLTARVLYYEPASLLGRTLPSARSDYPSVSLLPSIDFQTVPESQPAVHRLRLYCPQLRSRLTLRGRTFLRKP